MLHMQKGIQSHFASKCTKARKPPQQRKPSEQDPCCHEDWDKHFKILVDSGASGYVLPTKFLPKGSPLKKASHTLKMYPKSTMSSIGESKAQSI